MSEKGKSVEVNTGGGAYVGGDVKVGAGGRFIGRDEVIHAVSAPQGVSLAEFTALLAELRRALPEAGLEPEAADVVDADVRVVEEQIAKPKPSRAIIVARLEGITKLLSAAAGAATVGEKLLPLAQKAVAWAGQLFR